jgi:hypothetical protein
MRRHIALFSIALLMASSAFAAPTASVLGGGICINEVLLDANSGTLNFDTDGSGAAEDGDEFIELFNLSAGAIDISGWEIWETSSGMGVLYFTFPAATSLGAGNFAMVMSAVTAPGSLPVFGGGNLSFERVPPQSSFTNGGEELFLFNPGAGQYVHMTINRGANPPIDPAVAGGFSAGMMAATRVGAIDAFGADVDGTSSSRFPDGDDAVVVSNTQFPGVLATPGGPLVAPSDDPNATAPGTFNLPAAEFGGAPSSATLTITNSALSTNNLDIAGFNYTSGDMVFSTNTTFPINGIAPGATADINVIFTPTSAAPFSAVWTLDSNDPIDPTVTLNGTGVTFTNYATVADARTMALMGDAIRITGAVTLSVNPANYSGFGANRTYPVQDATGGILIVENETTPVLPGGAGAGWVVTGARGTKGLNFGIEQLTLTGFDSAVAGSALTPQTVTDATLLTSNADTFESEIITMSGVSFVSGGTGTGNWETGQNYVFQDAATNMFTVRLESGRTALVGTPLPVGSTSLTGIGDEFSGAGQLSPLAASDIGAPAAVADWQLFE